MKKRIVLITAAAVIAAGFVLAGGINLYIVKSTEKDIAVVMDSAFFAEKNKKSALNVLREFGPDCILVLGAGLKPDGTPNHMLEDRLEAALILYKEGIAPKLLLTGDHGQEGYDEVNAMRRYMEEAGVPAEDIFLDHAGFSTYESMYRAAEIFAVKKAVIVTQKYHQHRSLYIGKQLGIEVMGAASEQRVYTGQSYREVREIIARNKDFLKVLIKPEPTYLGDIISISGSGLASHDEKKK